MIRTEIKIDGMMCGMCEAHVNDAIRKVCPTAKVTSSHTKKNSVIISEDSIDEEKVKAAITDTGYQVLSIQSQPYEKKGLFGLFSK